MNGQESVQNALSFDLEHWYTATLLSDAVSNPTDHIKTSVRRVLEILESYDTTATFFVVGEVAEEYPEVVSRIAEGGHEIGSHGHTHTPLFELSAKEFSEELTASKDAIKRATGADVHGFRAPNFSVEKDTAWALKALIDHGFEYDSSVFPVRTPMYGVSGAPVGPYRIDTTAPFKRQINAKGILEAPVAVHPRFKLPVAGGFYARFLPASVIEWGIDALNNQDFPAVLYFHPWEFNPAVRSTEPPAHARFISYHGIERTSNVLQRLLNRYKFTSLTQVLD